VSPRPRTRDKPADHVAVRLDEETIARLDALIPALSTEWRGALHSDALRAVVSAGCGWWRRT
jgi:hypothetical protein